MSSSTAYDSLIGLLEGGRARYRLVDHLPEGRTELVSRMRGNRLSQAAKCMVVMVKRGKKTSRYVLAVVPGNMQVDLEAIKRLLDGTYVSFASPGVAEQLAGTQVGTILPVPLSNDLELIVDPTLLQEDEIYFNAGRLDRSVALQTSDYLALTRPRLERIGRTPPATTGGSELIQKVNVADKFARFGDYWAPKVVGEVNDFYIKAVKFKGEFVWHHHDTEDELFYVVKGRLVIKLRDGELELGPGEFAVIPRKIEHLPVAEQEVEVLLLEPKTTLNTGNVSDERTLETLQRI